MKKSIIIFILIYLFVGVLWTVFSGGYYLNQLKQYDGTKLFPNIITSVKSASIDQEGKLYICVNGRLGHSERYPVDISEYYIKLPINEIWKNKQYLSETIKVPSESSFLMEVTDEQIKSDCSTIDEKSQQIVILDSGFTAKETYRFWLNQEPLNLNFQEQEFIYFLPQASEYNGYHFLEPIKIFYVNKQKDVANRMYYEIKLLPSWKENNIGFIAYTGAFIIDTLGFPFQLTMLISG